MPDPDVIARLAQQLIQIARDLRSAGDVPLVLLGNDGVEPHALTLAGELELIAMQLDWDGVVTDNNVPRDHN